MKVDFVIQVHQKKKADAPAKKMVWQQWKPTNSAPYRSSTGLQGNKQLSLIKLKLMWNILMIQGA